jgi:D-alanine transaminase
MATVYLNGQFMPAEQATVSVLDRGFIFGDGVYEVIPVYGGHLFRFDHHLERLQNSLDAIRITNPLSRDQWHDMLTQLVQRNGDGDQSVYLQVTRGVAKRDHAIPPQITPTVFAMSNPLITPPMEQLHQGVAAITVDDIRWQNCHIKAISLLPNILLRQQAVDADTAEAILIRDGLATEGAASNLFIVKDGAIITPPKGPLLLPGITRDLILELARDNGIPAEEAPVSMADLAAADEVWLSSSTKEILPVTRLDDRPVGNGEPGPLWRRMLALFQDYKQQLRRGERH